MKKSLLFSLLLVAGSVLGMETPDNSPAKECPGAPLRLGAKRRLTEQEEAVVDARVKQDLLLIKAAQENDIVGVFNALNSGANVNASDNDASTPLYYAAQKGHSDIVWYLLDNKADYNRAARFLESPLAAAVRDGHKRVVDLLIAFGARNSDALEAALDQPDMFKELVDRGIKPGISVTNSAIKKRKTETLQDLHRADAVWDSNILSAQERAYNKKVRTNMRNNVAVKLYEASRDYKLEKELSVLPIDHNIVKTIIEMLYRSPVRAVTSAGEQQGNSGQRAPQRRLFSEYTVE